MFGAVASAMMGIKDREMPEEALAALRRSPEEFAREMRLAAAIHWYERGEVSEEKAAEIAGLDRPAFLKTLAAQQQEAFVVDFADLRREIERG
jgi:predicted HTH domain antitoxin